MSNASRMPAPGMGIFSILLLAACSSGGSAAPSEIRGSPTHWELPPAFTQTLTPSATFPPASSEVSVTPTPPAERKISPAPPIAAGWNHTCAITDQGGVMCWGSNDNGQLGDGSRTDRNQPVGVKGLTVRIVALAAGWGHTCALTTGGGVKCWGRNKNGELGNGSTQRSSEPVDVTGLTSGVVAIAAGDDHTCAITAQGALKCWGYNNFGQLGDGTTETQNVPVDVPLGSATAAVSAGSAHTCAWAAGGEILCWGNHELGQLGDGSDVPSRYAPAPVTGLSGGIVSLTAKGAHTCVLAGSGGIQCWGENKYGQLGDETTVNQFSPVSVNGLEGPVTAVAVGWYQSCGVMSDGVLKCWGWNFYGQLGDGSMANRVKPVAVTGLPSKIVAVAGGGGHTCALTDNGNIFCWGLNTNGQLGDRTNQDSLLPVKIQGILIAGVPQ